MAFRRAALALLVAQPCLSASVASSSNHAATPISKVIELLQGMLQTGKVEKQEEEKRFASFAQWCKDSSSSKEQEITRAADHAEMLDAKIAKAESHSRSLFDRVQELDGDIGRWQKDSKSVSEVRSRELADYTATTRDYQESLDALDDAIALLKKQAYSRPQAEAMLVQLQGLAMMPKSATKALAAFLQQAQQPDEQLFLEPPEAHGYEFQSGGVVDMLEKLKDEFASKKYELDQEEMNAKHAFELMIQQLTDSVENAKHETSKKTIAKSESDQLKAESEGNLKQTVSDKTEDEAYLADMTALCKSKTADFNSRQELRAQELVAMEKAVEVLSGESVAGAGDKYLPGDAAFVQKRRQTSLAQVKTVHRHDGVRGSLQAQIAAFLAERGQTCNSKLLTLISQRVATDPFDKVKKMIKDLISKLMEESTSETEQKGWCDAELASNKLTRAAKTEEVSKLSAEVEALEAAITQLVQDNADLASEIQELAASMATAAQDRAAEKSTNEQTIKEAKGAQLALERAVTVVKEFYTQSAQATSLLQTDSTKIILSQSPLDDAPETFDKPYQGQMPAGGSVVDFLEVILSDFARLEADTANSEATSQDVHEKFMFESKKDKALKENEVTHNENSKTNKESALHSTQNELAEEKNQLDKAMVYYDKLKPTCVDSGLTYEDRVKRRGEEIQSLQEALKILAGTEIDM